MAQYVYTMNRVNKVVPPKKQILKDVSLSFFPGAKIGVLGLNGSGKSTILRIMAGVDTEFEGEARPMKGLKVGYLAQEPDLDESLDVRGNVEQGVAETKALLTRFDEISMAFGEEMSEEKMNELLAEQAELQNKIDASNAWELDHKLQKAADALRIPDWDAEIAGLSGGEKRRVALCKLLLSEPDMLLLDEPTNHLDADSVGWLEKFLETFQGTVVCVTHDRYFLDNVAGWILEIDRGRAFPYEGNYSDWLVAKQLRLEQESKQEESHKKTMARELEWVRQNQKGRQAKSKARLARFEDLQDADFQKRNETNELYIPPGPRLGSKVVEVRGVSKGYGDKLLVENLEFDLPPGGIVGIIGPNGAGKTTLFKMMAGLEKPDGGTIEIGATVNLAMVDQSRDALNGENTVWQEISEGADRIQIGDYEIPSRHYVSRFNFKKTDQQKFIKDLSGGERNRVHLAKLLRSGGNVILLDEPTNDLDVETLRALEDAILAFPGCIVVISHDRWFLDRVATHILAFEGDSHVEWFPGNYAAYVEDRKKRLGDDAEPHKIKFRRFAT